LAGLQRSGCLPDRGRLSVGDMLAARRSPTAEQHGDQAADQEPVRMRHGIGTAMASISR